MRIASCIGRGGFVEDVALGQPRALVVDDNRSLAETVGEILADEGFEVEVATSAVEALLAWREAPAELVVADLDLPDVDGVRLARRLGRRGGGCRFILTSARPLGERAGVCEELGAEFLGKPFSPGSLRAAVRRLFTAPVRKFLEGGERVRLLGPARPRGLLEEA